MKRYYSVLCVICLCLLLTGCDLWMDGSYHSVEPYRQEYVEPSLESAEVTSYEQLQDVLTDLVANGSQESVVYMVGFDRNHLDSIMDMAVKFVTQSDPVGAYAVEKIDYEIGTNTGRTAIAVQISYIHNRSEILRIRHTENMEQAGEVIDQTLKDCEAGVVLLVEEYKETDFTQKVQDYVDGNPLYCMEMPQVTAAVYPNSGIRRVVELSFTYQTSRESLRTMQQYVEPVFRAAYLNVSGEEDEQTKFSRMYSFLIERSDYTVETSITPTYSLLRHGVGDSKAFATVYAAMCRQAGLECMVVTGTREGEPWVWNMVCIDGMYAHLDLLSSDNTGRMMLKYQSEMDGYVWDYSAYPEARAPEPAYTEEPVQPGTEPALPEEETGPAEETEQTQPSTEPSEEPTQLPEETTEATVPEDEGSVT